VSVHKTLLHEIFKSPQGHTNTTESLKRTWCPHLLVAIPAGQMERRVPEDVDMAPWIRLDQLRVGSDQELHCLKPAT